jgi:cytochrome c-type biogenesis protein CcmH
MIGFFVAAGLLVAVALFFVVPPLIGKRRASSEVSHGDTNLSIYRDQLRELDAELGAGTIERLQYESAKREIERRVLEEVEEEAERRAEKAPPSWTLAIAVAVGIPVIAIPLYLMLGNPAALNPDLVAASQGGDQGHALTPEKVAAMVGQLKQKLAANPDDGDGWLMLAKTTSAIGRFDESAKAYAEAVKRVQPDAQVYADYADTLAMASGRSLMGPPEKLIEQALKIDGNNVKALALQGTIAFQRQEYAKAAASWKKIQTLVPPDSELAQRIAGSIADAEAKAGGKTAAPALAAAGDSKPAAVGSASLNGQVELSAEAAKTVAPGDTVFVFARAASGPKMPLAIVKLQVKDLPTAFKLDESMAMAPGMSIAKFSELVVGARVSKSGNATPAPGDWESELAPAKVGASDLRLVIKRKI